MGDATTMGDLRGALDSLPVGVALVSLLQDDTGQSVDLLCGDVNDRGAELLAIPREHLLGRRLSHVLDPAVTADLVQQCSVVATTGEDVESTIWVDRGDGQRALRVQPFRAGDDLAITWWDVTARELAQAKLVEASAWQSAILNHAAFAIVVVGLDGRFVDANPAAVTMFGRNLEDLRTCTVRDVIHPEDTAKLAAWDQLVNGEIQSYDGQRRYVRPDGTTVDVRTVVVAIPGPDGAPQYSLGIIEDITETRRLNQELRASQERFRLAHEQTPVGMAIVDLDGRWLDVNPALCRFLGRPPADLMAISFQDITHPDDLEADLAQARRLAAGEITGYEMDKRYVLPDGRAVWAHLTGSVVRDADGAPQYFVAQVLDIEARKRNEELVELLFGASPDLLALLDTQGRFVRVNPSWEHTLGWSADELLGRPFPNLVHPDDASATGEWFAAVRDGQGDGTLFTNRYTTRDGSHRWLQWRSDAVPDTGLVVANARDITHERQMAAELEAREQLNQAMLDAMKAPSAVVGPDGVVVTVNGAWREWAAYADAPDAGIGLPYLDACTRVGAFGRDADHVAATVAGALTQVLTGQVPEVETEYRRRTTHQEQWFQLRIQNLSGDRAVLVHLDITAQKQVQLHLAQMALHDPLTRLANRPHLMERLRHLLARRDRRPLAVAYADLDDFKAVNDRFGHAAGDDYLCTIAQRLQSVTRGADLVARLGGDEFVVLAEVNSPQDAATLVRRLVDAAGEPLALAGTVLTPGISVGLAYVDPADTHDVAHVLAQADAAMFEAKGDRRPQLALIDDGRQAPIT